MTTRNAKPRPKPLYARLGTRYETFGTATITRRIYAASPQRTLSIDSGGVSRRRWRDSDDLDPADQAQHVLGIALPLASAEVPMSTSAVYFRRIGAGLCGACGQVPHLEGARCCARCRDRNRARDRKRGNFRSLAGRTTSDAHCDLTFQAITEMPGDFFKLSRERVRQIEAGALRKLVSSEHRQRVRWRLDGAIHRRAEARRSGDIQAEYAALIEVDELLDALDWLDAFHDGSLESLFAERMRAAPGLWDRFDDAGTTALRGDAMRVT